MEWWASDWCLAWQPGCDVAWTAWAAIGSLASAMAAVGVTWFHVRRENAAKLKADRIVLRQLCMEATRIYSVAQWSLEVLEKAGSGAIGKSASSIYLLALEDLQHLATPCYDAYGARLIEIDVDTICAVGSCFVSIKELLGRIPRSGRVIPSYAALAKQGHRIVFISNAAKQVVSAIGKHLGDDVSKALDVGSAPYIDGPLG